MTTAAVDHEHVSGLDDLFYDVTLTDESTGLALTSGTVTMRLCTAGTATALEGTGASVQALAHVLAGRWTGVHESTNVATAIAGIAVLGSFDRCVSVEGQGVRFVARCVKVAVVAL